MYINDMLRGVPEDAKNAELEDLIQLKGELFRQAALDTKAPELAFDTEYTHGVDGRIVLYDSFGTPPHADGDFSGGRVRDLLREIKSVRESQGYRSPIDTIDLSKLDISGDDTRSLVAALVRLGYDVEW